MRSKSVPKKNFYTERRARQRARAAQIAPAPVSSLLGAQDPEVPAPRSVAYSNVAGAAFGPVAWSDPATALLEDATFEPAIAPPRRIVPVAVPATLTSPAVLLPNVWAEITRGDPFARKVDELVARFQQ